MTQTYQGLRTALHVKLLDTLELEHLGTLETEHAREYLTGLLHEMISKEGVPLSSNERERIVSDVLDEMLGLGPIEALLSDTEISDILVNGTQGIYIEKHGKLEQLSNRFDDNNHLMRIIQRVVSRVGRRIDEASPMVDARLPDGSRVNAIIPPLAVDGPALSIRRFTSAPLEMDQLIGLETVTQPMLDLLQAVVRGRLSVLISGGTGTGKTTLLNAISVFISPRERIITIEDAAELKLKQQHVVRLETRSPNIEGKGEVRQRQLVINSLRMRPDRIIVGEVRGDEALDMLQAMNTGHDGSLTTIHANSPRDALSRIETMVAMTNLNIPDRVIRQQIASAIAVVIQLTRFSDGSRKVTSISEITGMEGWAVSMQDIFVYERHGYDKAGKVRGEFKATGIRPRFCERLSASGIELPLEMFAMLEG